MATDENKSLLFEYASSTSCRPDRCRLNPLRIEVDLVTECDKFRLGNLQIICVLSASENAG